MKLSLSVEFLVPLDPTYGPNHGSPVLSDSGHDVRVLAENEQEDRH